MNGPRTIPRWLSPGLHAVLIRVLCLLVLVSLFVVMGMRIPQPFALELLEEGVASMAVRVLEHGLCALYDRPDADFVPLLYGPLYPSLGALGLHGIAPELYVLRGVSVAALCGTLLLLSSLVVQAIKGSSPQGLAHALRDTNTQGHIHTQVHIPLPLRWLAPALFASTFAQSAYWFDLARVDMLALFLSIAGIWLGIRGRSLSAGVLLGLSLLTKQTALPITIAFCIGLCFLRVRSALLVAGSFALVGIAPLVWLHVCTDGFSTFYLWTMPGQHPIEWSLLLEIAAGQWSLLPMVVAAGFGLLHLARQGRTAMPLLFALLGALSIGVLARIRVGGSDNVLMPAHAALVVLAVLGLVALARRWTLAPLVIVLVQFGLLVPSFQNAWPSDGAVHGKRLTALLRTIDEPVFAPTRPFLLWQLGKGPQVDGTAAWDVLRSADPSMANTLREQLTKKLMDGSQRALLVSSPAYVEIVGARYPRQMPAFPDGAHLGVRSFDGFEQLFWMLKANDQELAERIEASWR